jgi:hypothetical protein
MAREEKKGTNQRGTEFPWRATAENLSTMRLRDGALEEEILTIEDGPPLKTTAVQRVILSRAQ